MADSSNCSREADSTCCHAPALSRAASHAAVSRTVSSSGRVRAPRRAPGAVDAHEAGGVGIGRGNPQRQAGPRLDVEVEQGLLVHPCGHGRVGGCRDAGVDEIAHRPLARGGAGVERAFDVALAEIEQPRREVPRVDELQRTLARRGHHRARRPIAQEPRVHEARDPVAEAVGGVVRADDQARPHDRRAVAVRVAHDGLARGLESAVVGQHVLGRGVVERGDGRGFVETGPIGPGDHRQRRHEHVAATRGASSVADAPTTRGT